MAAGTTFGRIFAGTPSGERGDAPGGPTLHELFQAAINDDISIPELAQVLPELHGVRLTPQAQKLLASPDAHSGHVSFAAFQRALAAFDNAALGGAGMRNQFKDQASAIIADNCGAPIAPEPRSATKLSTDISSEKEAFVQQTKKISERQGRGPFNSNPVVPTNRVSRDNPMYHLGASEGQDFGPREMAQTATRLYIGGEIKAEEYKKCLLKCGVRLTKDSEVQRLIDANESVGDGSFVALSRALKSEFVDLPPPSE